MVPKARLLKRAKDVEDGEGPNVQAILDKAGETDFEDEASSKKFESAFLGRVALDGKLLYELVELDSREFYTYNGPALLGRILRKDPRLLTLGPRSRSRGELSLLHSAIERNRHHFLDTVLDISDETGISLESALEAVDHRRGNCLHAAISRRLPCSARMVMKSSENALTMRDCDQNTPLHLAMENRRMIFAPRQNERKNRTESTPSKEARVFDPADILEELKAFSAKNSTDKLLTKLFTAINAEGYSPFQIRYLYFTERHVSEEDMEFLGYFKDLIFDSLTEISDIERALYGIQKPEKELYLDMSDFGQCYEDFKLYLDQLTDDSADTIYEETLVHVCLPDLNTFEDEYPYDWVRNFFSWLWNKKVRIIRTLSLPDSITNPICEELVEEAILNRFEIRIFHWRRLDINLDILTGSKVAHHLTEISLYSSGNWSVLYHWVSEDGLPKLPKLRKVRIEILELDPRHDNSARQRHNIITAGYKLKLDEKLEEMRTTRLEQGEEFEYEVLARVTWGFSIVPEPEEDELFPSLKLLEQLKKCHTILRNLGRSEERKDIYYAQRFKNLTTEPKYGQPDTRIKIAIIDNGADKLRSTIKNNIANGQSFVTADSETGTRKLPWSMVADPHGTQMASLIKKANPFCRLYIARVGRGHKDIAPENAAKAVEWAIEQEVDVISISWIIKEHNEHLKNAIQDALNGSRKHHPILVFCSTADEGVYAGKSYPADYDGTVSVAATDKYGRISKASQPGVDILVPGEDVEAEGPSYMGKYIKATVSGSSVATALASGIASLALLLLRTFNNPDNRSLEEMSEKAGIMKVFAKMNSEINGIQLFDLFPEDDSELPFAWKISNF